MKIKRIIYAFLAFLFLGSWINLITPSTAYAQAQPLNISISPPVAYIHVKPGEKLKHSIKVRNDSEKIIEVSMTVTDFSTDGKYGQPVLGKGSIFSKQIKSSTNLGKPFTLSPNQTKNIEINMDIAPTAVTKEYPLTFLFTARTDNSFNLINTGSKADIAAVIGSNLIVSISPADIDQGKIIVEKIDSSKIIDSLADISFNLTAFNQGQNATAITGKAILTNLWGKTVQEYSFYPDIVLAQNSRMVRGASTEGFKLNEDGTVSAEQLDDLNYQFKFKSLFLFGVYELTIILGSETRIIKVLALPFSIVVLPIGIIVIYFIYKKIVVPLGRKDY